MQKMAFFNPIQYNMERDIWQDKSGFRAAAVPVKIGRSGVALPFLADTKRQPGLSRRPIYALCIRPLHEGVRPAFPRIRAYARMIRPLTGNSAIHSRKTGCQ